MMRDAVRTFEALKKTLGDRDGVVVGAGRGFGSGTLKVDGRIFAMLSHDQLVVKLPSRRVAELIAAGRAATFDAGKGRPMKEWVTLQDTPTKCLALAEESLTFVRQAGANRELQ